MPYSVEHSSSPEGYTIVAWPYRSLPKRGFVAFLAATWALLMIPAFALLGTAALWMVLPFMVLALAGIWHFIGRTYRDAELTETLCADRNAVSIIRRNPDGTTQDWQANTHWVELKVLPRGGPVEQYLTLRGSGRQVEFGAFLTPEERLSLSDELQALFVRLRGAPGPVGGAD